MEGGSASQPGGGWAQQGFQTLEKAPSACVRPASVQGGASGLPRWMYLRLRAQEERMRTGKQKFPRSQGTLKTEMSHPV